MSPLAKKVLVLLLLLIPAVFYTLASFYHLAHLDQPLYWAIPVAILFASCEYVFRVPIITYAHKAGLSNTEIQIMWILATLFLAYISDIVMYKK